MKKAIVVIIYFISVGSAFTQGVDPVITDTVSSSSKGTVSIGGYIDTYYTYHSRNPDGEYAPYLVNSSRKNNLAINLAYVDIMYSGENVRVRLVPGFGTYMNLNYGTEPGTLKNLYEGYVGIRLSEKKNIWLDAGLFGATYTNESPVSKDNLMYTRSLGSEYSPYYLSGLKLSFPIVDKWNARVFLLNGWQIINDTNSKKSIGTQVEYNPNDNLQFSWSTYVGDERSDAQQNYRIRMFSDWYCLYKLNDEWDFTADAYIGLQQYNSGESETWWQANGAAQYSFAPKSSLSGRFEVFSDARAVVAQNEFANGAGFKLYSTGLCYNYQIHKNALFRMEGRYFFAPDAVFIDDDGVYKNSTMITASLTAWF